MTICVETRAGEISRFLGVPEDAALERLSAGFAHNHALVAEDFRAADPQGDDELLTWYRRTDAYIWELSAYHLDAGFNYSGMCDGIVEYLRANRLWEVLILGDGVGDLSNLIYDRNSGLVPTYHDLEDSKTARFADFVSHPRLMHCRMTRGWEPPNAGVYDAVVALDFFEHLPNVEVWARAVARLLDEGGHLLAQNAFAIGDAEHGGSIPMHLSSNNHFEKDWHPLMESLGLELQDSGWWKKPWVQQ